MSKFLKTTDYCIDLETVLWITNSNRPFYGIVNKNKYLEKTKSEYDAYPIHFEATKRDLTFYSINEVDSNNTNNTGRHAFKHEYPIVMQNFEIVDDYEVDTKETEAILLLESSKEIEPDTLKGIEKIKKRILSITNFVEIDSEIEITRPFPIHFVENLIINPTNIYFIDKSKEHMVINFQVQHEFDRSVAIDFKSKEECEAAYKKLLRALPKADEDNK